MVLELIDGDLNGDRKVQAVCNVLPDYPCNDTYDPALSCDERTATVAAVDLGICLDVWGMIIEGWMALKLSDT